MKKLIIILYPIIFVFILVQSATADSMYIDFDSHPGVLFFVRNDGYLWDIDMDGPALSILKSEDDRLLNSNGFIYGQIVSNFSIEGDFTITTDFSLLDFPEASTGHGLNESVLGINFADGSMFEVLRFRLTYLNLIEAFSTPPDATHGVSGSSIYKGQYRISRLGSEVTGYYAGPNSSIFTALGTVTVSSGSAEIFLGAVQGANGHNIRSNTSMHISFDNLNIQADKIINPVPEPGSMLLLGSGLAGLAGIRRKIKS